MSGAQAGTAGYLVVRQRLACSELGSGWGRAGRGSGAACGDPVRQGSSAVHYLRLAGRHGWQDIWQNVRPGQQVREGLCELVQ